MIYLKFLLSLIKSNIGKVITLSVSITCFMFAGTISDEIITKHVVGQNTVIIGNDTTYVYLCLDKANQKEIEAINFKTELKILPSKTITYTTYSGINILLWVLFTIGTIVIVVGSFHPDEDLNWELRETWISTLVGEVKVIEESNKFNWVLRNKLLRVDDRPIDHWSMRNVVQEYYTSKNIFPDFISKEDRREKKLKKIGI